MTCVKMVICNVLQGCCDLLSFQVPTSWKIYISPRISWNGIGYNVHVHTLILVLPGLQCSYVHKGYLKGAGLTNCQIQVTMFAVNTVLLAESEEDLKWNVEKLHEALKRHKLKVNWSK